ncbi:phospholipase D family protein [Raoultella ornithinolytica]|uniref:phospholipase D family nuclease n=1 Tax=Raoultella ornithinolytica TaxID=54291 RepID=UPI000BFF2C53|nr:phospholipase D family protein [Raoultella ornithinolytica]ATM22348.1 endonuclease [Raoultella ornithinolytica]QHW70002.1 phospholipase D family protein [Raoultella ornithinolytica]
MSRLLSLKFALPALALSFSSQVAAAPDIEVGFSPEGSARQLVLETINQAQTSLQMIAYSFQAPDIARALVAAHDRGVKVQIVVDKRRNAVEASQKIMKYVAEHGVALRIDGHYHIQHDKTIIADGATVETGSFNYAPSAETKNSENVVVIRHQKAVACQYIAHWQSRWELGVPYAG